jgi:hypothetical protein
MTARVVIERQIGLRDSSLLEVGRATGLGHIAL